MLREHFQLWMRVLLDLVYPRFCFICETRMRHEDLGYICQICEEKIIYIDPGKHCSQCARPLSLGLVDVCSECREGVWYINQSFAIAVYDGILRECIQNFKYAGALYLSETLKLIFSKKASLFVNINDYDWVIPVPLHPRKYRERGFNQSDILAQGFECLHVQKRSLRRIRYSEGQTRKDRTERENSVRDAFSVSNQYLLHEKRILLIDDVFTTGATLNECARVLKDAGAKLVDVLVLARSVK
ncbi:MAG: ComF family protein [Chlamydiota bacterium]|nr:ComF family protein [Chlamydiota bacterium]